MSIPKIIWSGGGDKERDCEVESVDEFLKFVRYWRGKYLPESEQNSFAKRLWYRGQSQIEPEHDLLPGVYREPFSKRMQQTWPPDQEAKRLELESIILRDFITAGAAFLNTPSINKERELDWYFIAQHHGLPTRLLDWSSNPLAALYFATADHDEEAGEVFMMDAGKIITEKDIEETKGQSDEFKLYEGYYDVRHSYCVVAIKEAFWEPFPNHLRRVILPIQPDNVPGRIGNQSSCFTLHMNGAEEVDNRTLVRAVVKAGAKESIRGQLHELNINPFTIFHSLDGLALAVRQRYGIHKS